MKDLLCRESLLVLSSLTPSDLACPLRCRQRHRPPTLVTADDITAEMPCVAVAAIVGRGGASQEQDGAPGEVPECPRTRGGRSPHVVLFYRLFISASLAAPLC